MYVCILFSARTSALLQNVLVELTVVCGDHVTVSTATVDAVVAVVVQLTVVPVNGGSSSTSWQNSPRRPYTQIHRNDPVSGSHRSVPVTSHGLHRSRRLK